MQPAELATGGSPASVTVTAEVGKGGVGSARRAPFAVGAAVALLGAALGLSQVINGAYDEVTWGPIALGALALVLALAVAIPRRLPVAALLALLGLWLWSLLSSTWAESADAAHAAAARWLLYAAALAVLCWAIGNDRRRASIVLTGAAAGVLGVAIWMLARMLGGHGSALFLGTRLNTPLGYVNGQAGYLLAAVWPCLAIAERRGSRAAAIPAGAGVSGMVILTGLGLLTQSRSWGIGLATTTVLLLIVIPGRPRRAAAVLLVSAWVALIYPSVANVWRHPTASTGVAANATAHDAAVAIVIAAFAAGFVWGTAVWTLERLAPRSSRRRRRAARNGTWAVAAIVLLAFLAAGINARAITHRIRTQYNAFVNLAPTSGGTRLLSGGGDRYDYWRVAVLEFRSAPAGGVGAGNYQPGYYLHRRTSEEIQQAHSLELQTLAELGLVGALLLAAFLVAVATGMLRTARAARRDSAARALAVAAGGVFAGWLIQTSVDWLHLLPGLTGIALAAAAALLVQPGRRGPTARASVRRIIPLLAAAIAVAGTLTIAPGLLSLHADASAQRALATGQPRVAVAEASRALDYDPSSVAALELRAAGFARLHAFPQTLADIKRAVALEPHNWVTWALLGDLLTRRRERAGARSAYARAIALNPLEASLRSALKASGSVP